MNDQARPRILVLGGGFAGMYAAKELARRVRDLAEIELINEVNYFVFQPLLPEVAAGGISTRDAVSPLRQLLRGVKVRQAHIHEIDLQQRVVTLFQGQQRRFTRVPYDHLVLAVGQSSDLTRVPGLDDHALPMKTLADAHRLRNHVIDKLEHADITLLPEVKSELLTFTVIGAGFSGVEVVGEMRDLIFKSLSFYPNIDPAEIRMLLFEFAGDILGELPAPLRSYAGKHLEKQGIEVITNTAIAEATGTQIVTSNGEVIGTRTVVATVGNAPTPLVAKLPVAKQQGKVRTDRLLRVEGFETLWALGDAAAIPLVEEPSERKDYAPPTAQFAVREARALAVNIDAVLRGKQATPFQYKSKGALASLGGRRGVAQVFGVSLKGWLAWLLWRAYYHSFVPGFGTKVRIAMNWFLDDVLTRSTVQSGEASSTSIRYRRYRAQDRVFETGNRTDAFYYVLEGLFERVITDPESGERRVDRIGPGGHFGEALLRGEVLRIGTVRALEDSRVLVIEANDFRKLVNAIPALQAEFAPAKDGG